MFKRKFLLAAGCAALLLGACTTTTNSASGSPAAQRQSIDAAVNNAMSKLYAQVPEARTLVGQSKGVLVFPTVVSAGFVVGGSYGQGALRQGSSTTGYYSTAAGSVGLLAGADSKAVYVLFMTQEALDKFKASKGWTAGADANVSVINVGANAMIDTQTMRQPVVGFVLTNGGLMANLSLDGTKVTKLDL
ncbi:MAG: YSC84-related protein [Burkholderiales bacterium]